MYITLATTEKTLHACNLLKLSNTFFEMNKFDVNFSQLTVEVGQ